MTTQRRHLRYSAPTQAVAVAILAVLAGFAITHASTASLAALLAVCLLFVLARRRFGITVGLVVLALENGIPFLDTARVIVAGASLQDYLAVALIVALPLRRLLQREPVATVRATGRVAATLLVGWWLITLYHSGGEPLGDAAKFGRNYVIFPLLVLAFSNALNRREWRDAIYTLLAGAAAYAVGEIAITTHISTMTWLVHPVAVRTSEVNLHRVYAFMSDPAALSFCLAVGAALFGQSRRRRYGVVGLLLFGLAILLQQTRAIYITLPLALIATVAIVSWRAPLYATRLRRRVAYTTSVLTLSVAAIAVAAPHVFTTYALAPLSRFDTVSTTTGNLGYRISVMGALSQLLGGNVWHWLAGLGFLDPKYHYFIQLPLGTIRNEDLGLMDGVMLIGIVGCVLLYAIVALPWWRMFQSLAEWRISPPDTTWITFGVMAWLTQVLLASPTLGTLYEEQGQVLLAFAISAGLSAATRSESGRSFARHFDSPHAPNEAREPHHVIPPPRQHHKPVSTHGNA